MCRSHKLSQKGSAWWLILCVTCDWAKGCLDKTWFLGVSAWGFPGEISIWIGGSVQRKTLPRVGGHPVLRAWVEQKVGKLFCSCCSQLLIINLPLCVSCWLFLWRTLPRVASEPRGKKVETIMIWQSCFSCMCIPPPPHYRFRHV